MEARAHAIAAGLFVILLGCASAVVVWWMAGNTEDQREYLLVTTGSVGGLSEQSVVRYRGMRAGTVTDIGIDPANPREIHVVISLPANLPVTRGSRARLGTLGVTGIAYVSLDDDGRDPAPLTALPGELPRIALQPSPFEALDERALALLEQGGETLARLNRLLDDGNLSRLSAVLAQAERASTNIAGASEELPKVLAGLRATLSDENTQRLSRSLANLERLSDEAAPLAGQVRELLASLQQGAAALEAVSREAGGELAGTTLPRINATVAELGRTARQLNRLLAEFEASPQILLFGRGGQSPGPGEPGFSGAPDEE